MDSQVTQRFANEGQSATVIELNNRIDIINESLEKMKNEMLSVRRANSQLESEKFDFQKQTERSQIEQR